MLALENLLGIFKAEGLHDLVDEGIVFLDEEMDARFVGRVIPEFAYTPFPRIYQFSDDTL
jgi:hypothetical protein